MKVNDSDSNKKVDNTMVRGFFAEDSISSWIDVDDIPNNLTGGALKNSTDLKV
jgi:hypothetical protein